IQHEVSPVLVNTAGFIAEFLESSASAPRSANEFAVHAQHEWSLNRDWRINMGIRGSMAAVTNKEYLFAEPRLSLRYRMNKDATSNCSHSRMVQVMHRVSSSAASTPTDIWYPATDEIAPQTSHQLAAAWQQRIPSENIYLSAEIYYTQLGNLIGYEEGTNQIGRASCRERVERGEVASW